LTEEKRPARQSSLDDRKWVKPPLKFRRISEIDLSQMVEPDKKKYAEYYRALKRQSRLEEKWFEEDQRHLPRLMEIRPFLWT